MERRRNHLVMNQHNACNKQVVAQMIEARRPRRPAFDPHAHAV